VTIGEWLLAEAPAIEPSSGLSPEQCEELGLVVPDEAEAE